MLPASSQRPTVNVPPPGVRVHTLGELALSTDGREEP